VAGKSRFADNSSVLQGQGPGGEQWHDGTHPICSSFGVEKRRGGWSLELTEWRRLAPGQSSKMEGKMGRKGGPVRLALGEREGVSPDVAAGWYT
jgi:hypothetical protein